MQPVTFETMYQLEEKHWWFSGRRFLVKKLLKKYFANNKKISILDAGCGTGLLDEELKKENFNYQIVGVDSSTEAVNFSRKRGNEIFLSSLEDCPFSAQTFDVILLLDVIEHVPDEKVILTEMERLLKPNGLIIVFVPALRWWWSQQDVFLGHYRRYTVSSLNNLFVNKNWSVLSSGYFNFFLSLPILIVRKLTSIFHWTQKDEITRASSINSILSRLFKIELKLLSFIKFPFGVSAYSVIKKNN